MMDKDMRILGVFTNLVLYADGGLVKSRKDAVVELWEDTEYYYVIDPAAKSFMFSKEHVSGFACDSSSYTVDVFRKRKSEE